MSLPLPAGFTVRLARRVRVLAGGRVLIGGAPTTALALKADLFDGDVLRVTDAATSAVADRLLDLGIVNPVVDALCASDPRDLTVVVPVRDRPAGLRRLLASLDPDCPVIVVDDCSQDRAAVEDAAAGADLIRLEVNVGPAAARNAGLAKVCTPYVAFVDSDVELLPGALTRLGRHFADPGVVLVAPRIRGRLLSGQRSWLSRYDADRSSLDLGPDPGVIRPRTPISWVPSACLLARTSAIGDGFDPTMRVGEDVDLVWRLAARGGRMRYDPSVEVRHDARGSAGEVLRRKLEYGTSAALLESRHGRVVAPAVLAPWSTAVVLALVAQRRWSLPVAVAVTAVTAGRIASKLPFEQGNVRAGAGLAARGVGAAVAQTSDLALRHWWPLGLVASMTSRRARRLIVMAAVVEAAVDYRRVRPALDPVRYAAARRLDDLAYGSGVWLGAWRARSVGALVPDVPALTPHR